MYDKPRQCIKKQRYHFSNKGPYSQGYGFSSSHAQMWEMDHKAWALKTLEGPLDWKEIKLVNPKGNQLWIFIGGTNVRAEAPVFWPPDMKSWITGKDPDAGKDWGQEEKGMTEDEMVGWHHQLNGHEFEQATGVHERQGSLVCCSPWGHKESDMTEWLNKTRQTPCF